MLKMLSKLHILPLCNKSHHNPTCLILIYYEGEELVSCGQHFCDITCWLASKRGPVTHNASV